MAAPVCRQASTNAKRISIEKRQCGAVHMCSQLRLPSEWIWILNAPFPPGGPPVIIIFPFLFDPRESSGEKQRKEGDRQSLGLAFIWQGDCSHVPCLRFAREGQNRSRPQRAGKLHNFLKSFHRSLTCPTLGDEVNCLFLPNHPASTGESCCTGSRRLLRGR